MNLPQSLRRLPLVVALIAAPPVIGAVALTAIEAGRFMRPTSPRGLAPAGSFADAIFGGVEPAYAFIRAGRDPNIPIAFRDHDLTGDRQVMVPPLVLAVATQDRDTVMMLLSFGVRMDLPGNRAASCLATRLGYTEIAAIIDSVTGGIPQETCGEWSPASGPPLLAFGQ